MVSAGNQIGGRDIRWPYRRWEAGGREGWERVGHIQVIKCFEQTNVADTKELSVTHRATDQTRCQMRDYSV